jgi:hypothetical protein
MRIYYLSSSLYDFINAVIWSEIGDGIEIDLDTERKRDKKKEKKKKMP